MKRLAIAIPIGFVLAACSSTPAGDGGDGGAPDSGPLVLPDSGIVTGCSEEGEACAASSDCCTVTCANGLELQVNVCDPTEGLCLPELDDAGATPSCPVIGGSDGGYNLDGGPPDDCAVWAPQLVNAQIVTLRSLTLPPGQPPLAAGTGEGVGQLLVGPVVAPGPDGGPPPDAGQGLCVAVDGGLLQTWTALGATPPALALSGVWEGADGEVFAVGESAAGGVLWLEGSLDAGLAPLAFDGGPVSLQAILGLGAGEALAVGSRSGAPLVLHLFPDGGLASEPVAGTAGVTTLFRVTGPPGGPILALGEAPGAGGSAPSALSLFLRADGGWSAEGAPADALDLSDVAVGQDGRVWLAGDDGADGLAYTWSRDGGFGELSLAAFGFVAPLRAVHELPGGDVLFAAVGNPTAQPTPPAPAMLRWSAGAWSYEEMPSTTLSLTAIADDGAGETVAVGAQECPDCDAGEVPIVLRRLLP
ncbi:MAG TPA: hypothetical protein VMB50_12975 [Myxococcales bacterium]|nr:hypothetical protein [Myxococcales bacterium]